MSRTPRQVDDATAAATPPEQAPVGAGGTSPTRRLTSVWNAILAATGTVVGLAPHVLHHVGLLVGTAFLAGVTGTALFGVLGLVAAVPMLLRLRRRFAGWWAPAVGLGVFALMFAVSAFVLGPAISADPNVVTPGSSTPPGEVDHSGHHTP